jgi:large subunit ribosomal protein L24
MHVKTGDKVQVMAGRDKGRTGQVVRIDRKRSRVIVEGLNLVQRHTRPGPDGSEGGIIEKEVFLDASNVFLFFEELGKGVRTTSQYKGKDGSLYAQRAEALTTFGGDASTVQKVRLCKKTGEVFE